MTDITIRVMLNQDRELAISVTTRSGAFERHYWLASWSSLFAALRATPADAIGRLLVY